MRDVRHLLKAFALFLALATCVAPAFAEPDEGVIRLGPAPNTEQEPETTEAAKPELNAPRRGFDYDAFEARLESLWFQRKAFLVDMREADAERQAELILGFCAEEGVRSLDNVAGSLIAESGRYAEEGDYERALQALEFAESLDGGRPQIQRARASVLWQSGKRAPAAGVLLSALRSSLQNSVRDMSLFYRITVVMVLALVVCVLIFSLLMLVRYQIAFRHEVEEWTARNLDDRWAKPVGWAVLFLPLVSWIAAGWVALYWIVVSFRYMRRSERITAVCLLVALIFAVPAYRTAVTIYGMTADPLIRNTLDARGGEYDPDRILILRKLVEAHPEDPVYRFLLAGLYKNGRFFEEAFAEYKQAMTLDPSLVQAYINVGNIFYATGQYEEAISNYRKSLDVSPDLLLPYFNMHLAQSESFRFKEAEESLNQARQIDAERLGELLAETGGSSDRPTVVDAFLETVSVWGLAVEGHRELESTDAVSVPSLVLRPGQLINTTSILALLALIACATAYLMRNEHTQARRCIRCGRPFCHYCRSGREGREYCSQCLHLFVRGDGLAPETKNRKLYEVERYERRTKNGRRLVSLALPGAAQLLKGRAGWGALLLFLWMASLIAWQPKALQALGRRVGFDLGVDLLGTHSVPAMYGINPFGLVSIIGLMIIWGVGNVWRWQR